MFYSTPTKESKDESQYGEVVSQITDREKQQVQFLSKLLKSYFEIVRKNVEDTVTKIVILKLVNGVVGDLQKELVGQVYNGPNSRFKELLQEAGDVESKRHVCRNELEALRKAKDLIQMTEVNP